MSSTSSVHADPPPPIVTEPSGVISYATGSALGKGGFAICHRAEKLEHGTATGQIVALKIVKSKMEPAKIAQKVISHQHATMPALGGMQEMRREPILTKTYSLSLSYKSTASSLTRISLASIGPFLFRPAHMSFSNSAQMAHSPTLSSEGRILRYRRFVVS